MAGSSRILGIIPARGGSKGLPRKNLRPLAGAPLIAHTIEAARLCQRLTRCVVTTDDPEIAAVARDHGAEVPFLRPAELAQDSTPMAPVIRHALETIESQDGPYDAVVLLDPTSPSRDPNHVDAAIVALLASSADGIVAVSQPTFHPSFVGVREVAGRLERYYAEGVGTTRRQEVGRFLRINGNFYVWRTSFVRRLETSWFDEGDHLGFEIPESHSFSIDDLFEFQMIESLWRSGLVSLPAARTS